MSAGTELRSLVSQPRAIVIILALVVLGAAATLLVSLHVLDQLAWRAVHHNAERLMSAASTIHQEARDTLRAANATDAAPCTADDIALLRRLAFQSRAIKDVGRLSDGKLICSGTLGVLDEPYTYPDRPDLVIEGRYRVYTSLDLLIAPGQSAVIVSEGDANVVIDPRSYEGVVGPGAQASTMLVDHEGRRFVETRGDNLSVTYAEAQAGSEIRRGDTRLAAGCGIESVICVAAGISESALREDGLILVGFSTLVGGVAGGSIGVAILALMRRAQAFPRRLRTALHNERVQLLYQPMIDAVQGRTVGAEALLRLTLDGRPVPPETVADAAIRNGLSLGLLRAVMRAAAREVGPLLHARPRFRISFNVTAADIADPGLTDALRILLDVCASPSQIMLELTERHAPDPAMAAPAIERLRALGISVALDDFGMGYSNIATVTALKVDMVKLDRSFTEAIGTGSPREAVVPEIIALAAKLNLAVVAEGVETELQARFFAERGVPWHQGWLYGHPMTLPELTDRLTQEAERRAATARA